MTVKTSTTVKTTTKIRGSGKLWVQIVDEAYGAAIWIERDGARVLVEPEDMAVLKALIDAVRTNEAAR